MHPNTERSESIIDMKAQQANRWNVNKSCPYLRNRHEGERDSATNPNSRTDLRGKFDLTGISSFRRRCTTLLTTLTRRLPVRSGGSSDSHAGRLDSLLEML